MAALIRAACINTEAIKMEGLARINKHMTLLTTIKVTPTMAKN